MTNEEIIAELEHFVSDYTGKFAYDNEERRLRDDNGKGVLIDPTGLIRILNAVKANSKSAKINVWYCVTSRYHSNGRFTGAVTAKRLCKDKPESSRKTLKNGDDIYNDWFSSMKEAKEYIQNGINEN